MATKAGLRLEKTIYDSDAFQFWVSEQYVKDIPLVSERSWMRDRERSIFTPADIKGFAGQAEKLNREGRGDTAAFFLVKKGSGTFCAQHP